jgi:hypothetical protein
MQDPERCKDQNLIVSSADAHLHIALACLRIMNKRLHRDICDIGNFSVANTEITGIQKRIDECIPESLQYACTYWISHVVLASHIPPLVGELNEFCETHIFHWIEVLSFLRNLGAASGLRRALDWCRVSTYYLLITYLV